MKKGKLIGFLLSACMCILINGVCVSANTITMPDGTVLNRNTDMDSLPSSYDGVDYYDCLVPYAKQVKDIGGHAIGGKPGTAYASSNIMSTASLDKNVGDYINLEYFIGGSTTSINGVSVQLLSASGANYIKDSWGNKYYLIALGSYFYPQEAVSNGFFGFSSANRGQLVDIVFTSGTVMHCVIMDCKSNMHTNGGEGSTHSADETNACRDYYQFAPMEIDIGQNMFQAKNSEIVEFFSDPSGINNIRSTYFSGNAHIAFIRMYKGKFNTDGNKRKAEVGSMISYDAGDTTFSTATAGSGSGVGSAALGLTGSSLKGEWELTGMPVRNDLSADQIDIILLGRDSLSLTEAEVVSIMGNNISLLKEANVLDAVRTSIVFIGLIVILYGFMLALGIIFDKANTFIDFSMVNLFTFGKLHYDPFEEKSNQLPKGYISTKKLIMIAIITEIVGVFLISSGMTKLIGNLLYYITSYFS